MRLHAWLLHTRLASGPLPRVQWLSSKSILPEQICSLIHHLSLQSHKLTLHKGYGLRDYLACSSNTYLLMNCLYRPDIYVEKKKHRDLYNPQGWKQSKTGWTVERPGKFRNLRLVHTFHCPVQNPASPKIESIIQSIVQSSGFVPTQLGQMKRLQFLGEPFYEFCCSI